MINLNNFTLVKYDGPEKCVNCGAVAQTKALNVKTRQTLHFCLDCTGGESSSMERLPPDDRRNPFNSIS